MEMEHRAMRRKDRLVTEEGEIRRILDACGIVHLGLYDKGRIYVVPVNYSYTYEGGKLSLFFHGATAGLKRELIEKDGHAGFEMDTGEKVIPHDTNPALYTNAYMSIIGSGHISIIQGKEEKKEILTSFMKQISGKDWTITDGMLKGCEVYRLEADEFQAKRNCPGKDSDGRIEQRKRGRPSKDALFYCAFPSFYALDFHLFFQDFPGLKWYNKNV